MSTTTRTIEEEAALPPIQTSPKGRRSLPPSSAGSTHHRREARPRKPETSPWNLIMVGFCLGVAGGVGVALGSTLAFLGFVCIGIAAALSLIGAVAEGIRYGARWVAYDQADAS
jgi:hypothetical protein